MAKLPNVFTIAPGAPFLDTLVGALLDGRLIEGSSPRDPFALADTTIYLPTRRAARAIREAFLTRLGRALLLPRIRTLGDLDEDDDDPDANRPDLPPAVAPLERQLILTQLVLGWSGAMVRAAADFPEEELVVPASPADAAHLAAALGRLIDQVGTDGDAWRKLFDEDPGDLARYWQITLEFLKIATETWPAMLADRGMIDPGVRRDMQIRAEAARLAERGSPGPVIAAGSTGSVPATAALLAAIACLPNGAVVLPGLDHHLDADSWNAIGLPEDGPAGAGHPQYGLKRLLAEFGIVRSAVLPLGEAPGPLAARAIVLSEAMRPAATTDRWTARGAVDDASKSAALVSIGVIAAANEREEALAVALILRQAAESAGKVAALVTPDRRLARRVAIELKRWAIDVDDSAGVPLVRTAPGVLARLVAEAAIDPHAENILALLKHPLTTLGLARYETRSAAGALERAVLRGPRLKSGFAALQHALATADAARKAERKPREFPRMAAKGLGDTGWASAADIASRLALALAPLERLAATREKVGLAELIDAHFSAFAAVLGAPEGDATFASMADEATDALFTAFAEMQAAAAAGPAILPQDYPALFSALCDRALVRRRGGLDPRIHIWGTLEARLQSVDVMVLGGLNEGVWPSHAALDPLLSRPLRTALALEPPERRIGLAAHDFAQSIGAHEEVWLTRAERVDNEPKVASRWLQRLGSYAGATLNERMSARGQAIIGWARSLDRPLAPEPPLRPQPSPPLEHRPKKLYATRIETLIRDPYSIYAYSVLRLRRFEPLAKLFDAADRGSLIHDILEAFVRERPGGPFDAAAEARLLEIGREAFAQYGDTPEVLVVLWPRFERIARWFVRQEASRTDVAERHVECSGATAVTSDFEIAARADRIDRLSDGRLSIVDYKTGAPPSPEEVLSLSPQLPIEALIARAGGFEGIIAGEPAELIYYRLSGRGDGGEVHERSGRRARGGKPELTLAAALDATERRLAELMAYFAAPDAKYVSRKIPKRGRVYPGEYDHLARVAEWTTTEEETDEPMPDVRP